MVDALGTAISRRVVKACDEVTDAKKIVDGMEELRTKMEAVVQNKRNRSSS